MRNTTLKTIIGLATMIAMSSAMTACDAESPDELELRLAGPGPVDDIELEFEDGPAEVPEEIEVLTARQCKGTSDQLVAACSSGTSTEACRSGGNDEACGLVVCHGDQLYFCISETYGASCHFEGAPALDCIPMF